MHKQLSIAFWRDLYFSLATEVDQVLGKALGYPYLYKDQKNFPGTTEADGVCTGDNVPESLLAQAAKRIEDLSNPEIGKWTVDYRPKNNHLVLSESDNTPCTAALEVSLKRLVTYLRKRAHENERRATKEEAKLQQFHRIEEIAQTERSAYYFSGKADSYKRAADKLEELLKVETHPLQPEGDKWIVEVRYETPFFNGAWVPSQNEETKGKFDSEADALLAVELKKKKYGNIHQLVYRVSRYNG